MPTPTVKSKSTASSTSKVSNNSKSSSPLASIFSKGGTTGKAVQPKKNQNKTR